jgi:Histidine kinase
MTAVTESRSATSRGHRNAPLTPKDACACVCGSTPDIRSATWRRTPESPAAAWPSGTPAGTRTARTDYSTTPPAPPPAPPAPRGLADLRRRCGGRPSAGRPGSPPALQRLRGVTLAPATVHRILVRRGLNRLRDLDPPNGEHLWAIGAALRADVALFIALYSLTLHGRLQQLPWACAATAGALGLVAARLSAAISVWDALFFLLSTATAALALGLMIRIRRAQLAGLRDRAARLEIERDQRGRLAVAAERARVAREMHDIVGHNLSVIITLADAGAYATAASPKRGEEALHLIGDTGRQALGELRRVLGVLREPDGPRGEPELSPQPGLADIGALCEAVRAAGLEVVYRTAGDVDALDSGGNSRSTASRRRP